MPNRMTRHGPQQPIGAPALPVVDPDDFAEHVVDAFAAGDFLISTRPNRRQTTRQARRPPAMTVPLGALCQPPMRREDVPAGSS